jgi:hypothetical protein
VDTFSSEQERCQAGMSMFVLGCKYCQTDSAIPPCLQYSYYFRKASKALTNDHISFITMPDSAQAANKHLRIGGQNSILMFNREQDDATLPNLSPEGTASSRPLPVNTWTCFEYHLSPDGGIETWLDGTAIPGLTTASSNPYASQWRGSTIKPKVTGVFFGWESYGSGSNTIWYDDISVSSSRVGCGGSTPPQSTTRAPVSTTTSTTRIGTTLSTTTRTTSQATTTSQGSTRGPTTSSPGTTRTTTASGPAQTKWGQCGGIGKALLHIGHLRYTDYL